MKKLSDDEKAELQAKIEQARIERRRLITESPFEWKDLFREWQKESWEGVVTRKYWRECGGKWVSATFCYMEVCYVYGQTVKERGLDKESWELVKVGDYVIKKSGSDSIEKRAIQEEEAREARQILIQRLSHESKEIRSRAAEALGHIGDVSAVSALAVALKDKKKKVRMNATEALRQIGTPEAIEAVEK